MADTPRTLGIIDGGMIDGSPSSGGAAIPAKAAGAGDLVVAHRATAGVRPAARRRSRGRR